MQPALEGHRFVLVDLFGHGYGDAPPDFDYTIEGHARNVAELLDHLSISSAAIVGHSMGGSVAISLGVIRPELVERLILVEANLDSGGGSVSKVVAAQTETDYLRAGHGALLDDFWKEGLVTRIATFRACNPTGFHRSAVSLVAGTRPTWREALYRMPIPRMSVFGERSLPDPDTDELPRHGIRVAVVPDAGHDMPFDNPAGLGAAIDHGLRIAPSDADPTRAA